MTYFWEIQVAPTQQNLIFQPSHPFVGHVLAVKVSNCQSSGVQNNYEKNGNHVSSLKSCFAQVICSNCQNICRVKADCYGACSQCSGGACAVPSAPASPTLPAPKLGGPVPKIPHPSPFALAPRPTRPVPKHAFKPEPNRIPSALAPKPTRTVPKLAGPAPKSFKPIPKPIPSALAPKPTRPVPKLAGPVPKLAFKPEPNRIPSKIAPRPTIPAPKVAGPTPKSSKPENKPIPSALAPKPTRPVPKLAGPVPKALGLKQTGLFSVRDETPLELDLHVLEQVSRPWGQSGWNWFNFWFRCNFWSW